MTEPRQTQQEEIQAEESQTEESPAEESPAEESPAEESRAEERQAEESPAEERQQGETQAEMMEAEAGMINAEGGKTWKHIKREEALVEKADSQTPSGRSNMVRLIILSSNSHANSILLSTH